MSCNVAPKVQLAVLKQIKSDFDLEHNPAILNVSGDFTNNVLNIYMTFSFISGNEVSSKHIHAEYDVNKNFIYHREYY